jgi:cytochrome c-type biogenesis protein CcmH
MASLLALLLPVRRALALLATVALLASTAATPAIAQTADLADLEDEVMCVQCKRPLITSAGSAADDQRELMQDWIDEGLTKDQIKARLVAEYGDRALVDDRSGIAAAAPWLTALVGVTSIGLLLRRRRQHALASTAPAATDGASRNGDGPTAPPAPAVSADDDARIDAELAERD